MPLCAQPRKTDKAISKVDRDIQERQQILVREAELKCFNQVGAQQFLTASLGCFDYIQPLELAQTEDGLKKVLAFLRG